MRAGKVGGESGGAGVRQHHQSLTTKHINSSRNGFTRAFRSPHDLAHSCRNGLRETHRHRQYGKFPRTGQGVILSTANRSSAMLIIHKGLDFVDLGCEMNEPIIQVRYVDPAIRRPDSPIPAIHRDGSGSSRAAKSRRVGSRSRRVWIDYRIRIVNMFQHPLIHAQGEGWAWMRGARARERWRVKLRTRFLLSRCGRGKSTLQSAHPSPCGARRSVGAYRGSGQCFWSSGGAAGPVVRRWNARGRRAARSGVAVGRPRVTAVGGRPASARIPAGHAPGRSARDGPGINRRPTIVGMPGHAS